MSSTHFWSLVVSLGVAGVVVVLGGWQWVDRRSRGVDLSDEDAAHFARQDVRRSAVAGIMMLLAAGIYFGSRMPALLRNGRPNLWFLEVWLGVFLLVLALVVLALVDWLATRRYAKRHRNAIIREGLKILRDEMELRLRRQSNGRGVEGDGNRSQS